MSDLISRSVLLRKIAEEYDLNYGEILIDPERFYEMVEAMPTAYDIEKVAAELEAKENEWWDTYSLSSGFDEYAHGKSVGFEEAIDIVRKGGVE